jgi:UDP-3-O-acyl N-acetylglucosamine deacetylase
MFVDCPHFFFKILFATVIKKGKFSKLSARIRKHTPIEIKKTRKPQKTLRDKFTFEGIGIFSGHIVRFEAKPASPDTGIVFKRAETLIPADIKYIEDCPNRTKLIKNGVSIQVVEHLLAAFRGLEVDNAIVDAFDDELPILDASAKDYTRKILETGLVEQDAGKFELVVNDPIWDVDNDAFIALLPSDKPRITYFLDHQHIKIGRIADSLRLNPDTFRDFIGPARTFATREEASYMIENRIVGTSDENLAIIVGPDGPGQQLRHPLEFVHHKMLDMIGDLSLTGPPIHGHILGIRSGHTMNRRLAIKIASLL